MKKFFIFVFLGLLATTTVQAKCVGGLEFNGAINGHTYCRSKTNMTWWAAFAWCEHQGRHLASLQEACADFQDADDTDCPNMVVSEDINGNTLTASHVWTANSKNENMAYTTHTRNGEFNYQGVGNKAGSSLNALCY